MQLANGAHNAENQSLPYKRGSVQYVTALRKLLWEAYLIALKPNDPIERMQYNLKVRGLLGDRPLLYLRVDGDIEAALKGAHDGRSMVVSGTIDEVLIQYINASSVSK